MRLFVCYHYMWGSHAHVQLWMCCSCKDVVFSIESCYMTKTTFLHSLSDMCGHIGSGFLDVYRFNSFWIYKKRCILCILLKKMNTCTSRKQHTVRYCILLFQKVPFLSNLWPYPRLNMEQKMKLLILNHWSSPRQYKAFIRHFFSLPKKWWCAMLYGFACLQNVEKVRKNLLINLHQPLAQRSSLSFCFRWPANLLCAFMLSPMSFGSSSHSVLIRC